MEWDGSGESVVAAFSRWAAQERAAQAAGTRSRERSLREQVAGEATVSGVLVDLAETQGPVSLGVGARRLSGTLMAVAKDFCVLDQRSGRPALIRTERIVAVWKEGPASGSRFPQLELSFLSALSGLADERSPVHIHLAGGNQVSGELAGAGTDLVTLRSEPPSRRTIHVRTDRIEVCELR